MKNSLKALRQERQLTQQELADVLAVSRQTVNSIETGKYDPSLPLAFKLAQFLSLKIEDIFEPEEAGSGHSGCFLFGSPKQDGK
ncbi:MAG: helix-turn-helix transcriptional regulator [Pseudomonadota bacterium]